MHINIEQFLFVLCKQVNCMVWAEAGEQSDCGQLVSRLHAVILVVLRVFVRVGARVSIDTLKIH